MKSESLSFDVAEEMRVVDRFATELINDESLQKQFFKSPHAYLSRFRVGKQSVPPRILKLANQVLYATLSNPELIRYVTSNVPAMKIPASMRKKLEKSLAEGRVEIDPRIDEIALRAYLKDERHLKNVLLLILNDLNQKGILPNRIPNSEIRSKVQKAVDIYKGRDATRYVQIGQWPTGEFLTVNVVPPGVYSHTGSGSGTTCVGYNISVMPPGVYSHTGSGGGSNSVALCTAAVLVEIFAAVTVFGPVSALAERESMDKHFALALQGDNSALKTLATMARILSLASDLATFLRTVEQKA